ncbi:MAG: peptide deformylase [Devosiaceae bacterium]|nr:peptide deformylase [Devosiaceae bacterium]
MPLREILVIPDPRLRQQTKPVSKIDQRIKTLVKDMFDTMYDAPGIGLAAPQIGVMERVIVVDCAMRAKDEEGDEESGGQDFDGEGEQEDTLPDPDPEPIAMINPKIIKFSDELSIYEEGCLSIPEYYEDVERPKSCTVRYTDLEGNTVTRDIEGLLSTCVQHEVDHLDGKLFIDYLSRLKRERVTKKFKKAAKHAAQ